MQSTISIKRPTFGPVRTSTADDAMLSSTVGMQLRQLGASEGREFFVSAYKFRPELEAALSEVCDIAEEYSTNNWDGEGAVAVSTSTVTIATRFMLSLPMNTAFPEAGVHRDGEISLSWAGGKGHRLTLSIGPTGRISYAFMMGARRKNGTEWFADTVPSDVLGYILSFNQDI